MAEDCDLPVPEMMGLEGEERVLLVLSTGLPPTLFCLGSRDHSLLFVVLLYRLIEGSYLFPAGIKGSQRRDLL